jgi:hypothetical protein
MKNSCNRFTQREETMENHWRISKNCKIFKEGIHMDHGNSSRKKYGRKGDEQMSEAVMTELPKLLACT